LFFHNQLLSVRFLAGNKGEKKQEGQLVKSKALFLIPDPFIPSLSYYGNLFVIAAAAKQSQRSKVISLFSSVPVSEYGQLLCSILLSRAHLGSSFFFV